ncbi:DsbA family oxidoreductase [Natronocalculus amylovorans]|uniref:DsbA family oxidoreductase n=1 Tax=Natronocalculus amylovorans TaxID=2917812 RepID=A0AAE3FUW7_9EURY|nr:DsbA family oxidoreductase [Natronocalculus amylovorans]MCL9815616.1 DsbA family oxidoreductase [Natronocalculus amylovorans]NUE01871.1 DsbA family oxidoreductase [Halorubraceae archaeon YAN]
MSDTDTDIDLETVTIYSDYVCPFCYLGRASLEQYQNTRTDPVRIDWHPFDLRSQKRNSDGTIDHSVDDGKDDTYFEQAKENVRRLADKYDVEMTVEIAREVDSLPAQLVSYAVKNESPYETWLAFDEAVFVALWEEGKDIGDRSVLKTVAEDVGLEPTIVDDSLSDDTLRETVTEQFVRANQHGVSGVPTFAYDGHAARGAVPPEHLQRLIEGV